MTGHKRVHVAVAAICREYNGVRQVLLSRRAADAHQGNLWEFPGGKVEAGEQVQDALKRELDEELGIVVRQDVQPLIRIQHDYSDKQVLLDVWQVNSFHGDPHGREGQPVRWVDTGSLDEYDFPAANTPIIDAIRLPRRYLITPEFSQYSDLATYVCGAMSKRKFVIQVRQHQLDDAQYKNWANRLIYDCSATGGDSQLVWNRSLELLPELPAAGWHLSAAEALRYSRLHARAAKPIALGVSCHNENELQLAKQLGANYALLSPVKATMSHPEALSLGYERFSELVEQAPLPVYALGGLTEDDLPIAIKYGAQGVAAIRAWQEIVNSI